jgi:hypothetical protein
VNRRGFGVGVGRGAGAAGAAAALALWPGHGPGGLGVPVAHAGDEWCDTDPLLVIRTPAGHLVPVYCLIGVFGAAALVAGLVAGLTPTYTVAAAGDRTRVTVTAAVPCGGGAGYPTRLTVSSQALGAGEVYGQTTGACGEPLAVAFFLPLP